MEHHLKIGSVPLHSLDDHIFPQVKGVYELLLNLLIKLVVKGINPDDFIKNFREILSDFRRGKGNNRKASLLPPDIPVLNFPGGGAVLHRELLLLPGQMQRLMLFLKLCRLFPEGFHHCRSAVNAGLLPILFKAFF